MDETKTRAHFAVKVLPRSRKTELAEKIGDAYKLRLAAPPVDGKANEACARFFADRFGVSQSAVRIVRGLTTRMKVIEIDGVDLTEVERILANES